MMLLITAEGQTEQNFAIKVLGPHLAAFGVFVIARCVLTSKDRRTSTEYRGGLVSYEKAKKDIKNWLKEWQHSESELRLTTMFDLYALPENFPGYVEAGKQKDPYDKVRVLEKSMAEDINDGRFIPYIQLHEFETLIFADPQKLDWEYLDHTTPINNLVSMVANQNPELINDGMETAPSKRIGKEIPEYDKATSGVEVVGKIGIQSLRKKCRHFNEWLSCLEELAGGKI